MALKQPELKLVIWSDKRDKSQTRHVTISELPVLEIRKVWKRMGREIYSLRSFLSGPGLAALNALGGLGAVLNDIQTIALIAYFEGMGYTLKNIKTAHTLCNDQGKKL